MAKKVFKQLNFVVINLQVKTCLPMVLADKDIIVMFSAVSARTKVLLVIGKLADHCKQYNGVLPL